jgi:hypothetical protein
MEKRQREVEERNDTGLLTLMRKLFTGYMVRRGEKYRKTIVPYAMRGQKIAEEQGLNLLE